MRAQGEEGPKAPAEPSESDILEQAWSKYWYFAEEALPERVDELKRLLPAARTYGITAPLEDFLRRHTGAVVSIDIDGSPRPGRGAERASWPNKLIDACRAAPEAREQFCLPALPHVYRDLLDGASLLRDIPWQTPVYASWSRQFLDDSFTITGFVLARDLLERLRPRPLRPPDFSRELRRFRAWLRRTLPRGTRIPTAEQLERLADKKLEPRFEDYRAFLAPIAERNGGVFTWETKYG
jgi:hypothetical protein